MPICRPLGHVLSFLAFLLAPWASADPLTLRGPGESIARAFNERDVAALAKRIDTEALLATVLTGMDLGEKDRRDMSTGFRKSSGQLPANLMRNVDVRRGKATHVLSAATGDGSRQIIRIDFYDQDGNAGGSEYLEFQLGQDHRIRDWYSHAQASQASGMMRQIMMNMLDDASWSSTLLGRADVNEAELAATRRYADAIRRADMKAAHAALGGIGGEFRKSRQWATMRAALASSVGEAEYRADLDYLAKHFGDDPAIQFMLIDHHFYRKDYGRMLETIRRFERRVVEDANTNVLECNGLAMQEAWPEAIRACRHATRLEPDNKDAWWSLVGVQALGRDGDGLLDTLARMEQRFAFSLDPDALVQQPNYGWLKEHPGFKAWAKARR